MAKSPKVFSLCERSPWYSCTWSEQAFYGEYAGRIVLLSLGNDVVDEYWTLRKAVGLFDVPERPVEISGPDSVAFLNRVFTRPVDKMPIGRGRYGLLCHQRGGLVCDGIIFKIADERFWYVHADADVYSWLVAHALNYQVEIRDPKSWVIQIQGPRSMEVLANADDQGMPEKFNYFDIYQTTMGGQPVLVSRTGWTNELGFEVYNFAADVDGPALWQHLMDAGKGQGIVAAGQLAMNIRRIEGGILNYPTDIDWYTTPYDVGLGAFVDLDHDFIGRDALAKANHASRFSGFKCKQGNLRYRAEVYSQDKKLGRVTAFEFSPFLQQGVGFVLFDEPEMLQVDNLYVLDRDDNQCEIALVDLPFYDAEKNLPRGLPPGDDARIE